MLKRAISFLVPVTVLAVLFYEIVTTPFYSRGELDKAREQTVAAARGGDFDRAYSRFEALLGIAPRDVPIRADYLTVLHWDGRHREALEQAGEVELDALPTYALDAAFGSALALSDADAALRVARALLRAGNDPAAAIDLAQRLDAGGHRAQALLLLDEQSAADPQRLELALARAGLLAREDIDAALALGRALLREHPADPRLFSLLADLAVGLARAGDLERGRQLLAELLAQRPGDDRLRGEYVVLLHWSGVDGLALMEFDRLQRPASAPRHVRLAAANAALRSADAARAARLYAPLYDEQAQDPTIARGYARALVELGAGDEALAVLRSIDGADGDLQRLLAEALNLSGDPARAAQTLAMLLQDDPTEPQDWRGWIRSLERSSAGLAKQAAALRRELATRAPADVRLRAAVLLAERGEFTELAALLDAGADDMPMQQALEDLAYRWRVAERLASAQRLYELLVNRFPDRLQSRLGLALVASAAGRREEADRRFADLLARHGDRLQVVDAALNHALRGEDYTRARPLFLRAIALGGDLDAYLDRWLASLRRLPRFTAPQAQLAELQAIAAELGPSAALTLQRAQLQATDGRCGQARAALEALAPPALGLEQLDRAAWIARDCGFPDLSGTYYAEAQARRPDDPAFAAGLLQALVESGELEEARALWQRDRDRFSSSTDFLHAAAYALLRGGDYPAAIAVYERLLELDPDDREAYVSRAVAVNAGGDPDLALELAHARETWFETAHLRRFYSDRAALAIRRAAAAGRYDPDFRALNARALALSDDYIAWLRAESPPPASALRRALMDRLTAERQAGETHTVLATLDEIGLPPGDLPDYVLIAVADAQLQLRRPEAAIELLEFVTTRSPGDERAAGLLFFAYLEAERFGNAGATIAALADRARTRAGTVEAAVPWALRTEALFEAYANDLSNAQRRLEALRLEAPEDRELALALAAVYRWRGWPERAAALYRSAQSLAGPGPAAELGIALSDLDRRRLDAAARARDVLAAAYPEDRQVSELDARIRQSQLAELWSRFVVGESSGSTFGSEDRSIETKLFSRPFATHYRAFAQDRYSWARFPEGNGSLHRLGAGLEYRGQQFTVTGAVDQSLRGDGEGAGLRAGVDWLPDDHWSLSLAVDSYSSAVPLRAINAGISGESATVAARYRWHESRDLRLSAAALRFDDGNERESLFAAHRHRVWQAPHHSFDLIQQAYYSRNSAGSNAPYFNPESDWSVGINGEYLGILQRRYERRWTHRFNLGIGRYEQEGFGSSTIWDLDYEHVWENGRGLRLGLGVLHRQRSYDGEDEDYDAIYGSVSWRF